MAYINGEIGQWTHALVQVSAGYSQRDLKPVSWYFQRKPQLIWLDPPRFRRKNHG
jgi:hypothetical protein